MAARNSQFEFCIVELFKEDTLGTGSYGGVCKAKCDGLPCAAKIMHPTLFDLRDPGTVSYLERFEEECRLLGLARHPNVVTYLGTYRDPETRFPVLLMELCDESLCRFLEHSPRPVAYHIQLNIARDIALALVYLHLNGLTHRDLTGNNVLLIAGSRAKVTDFGMSRLTSVNPRMTPLTLCPGNMCYMSPEALEEPPSYTTKLDVFSFGVILIQIMTRQFPDPGPRFKSITVPGHPDARVPAPETERRASHLKLIADAHPLKVVAIHCLKDKERERPRAQQLNDTLSEMKQAPEYTESLQQSQASMRGEREVDSLRRQIRDLQQQVSTYQEEIQQKEQAIDQKLRKNEQLQFEMSVQIQRLQQQLHDQRLSTEAKTREVQQVRSLLQDKERDLQAKDRELQRKVRELQEKAGTLRTSEQLVPQTLKKKDRAIRPLPISASHRERQQLQRLERVRPPPSSDKMTVSAVDISKLRWEDGKQPLQRMVRGSAAVDGNIIYINSVGSHNVYSCQVISSQQQQWSTLSDHQYVNSCLVVIDGILTSVGGGRDDKYINSLLSLRGEKWSKVYPAMPTPRSETVSLTTQHILIVAGGFGGKRNVDIVEVMDIPTRQWSTASPLPHPFGWGSGTICGDKLYLAGGYVRVGESTKSVLTCSVSDLLSPPPPGARLRSLSIANKTGVWQRARDLPITKCTVITLGGHLLAIGGRDISGRDTSAVHCYDNHTNSWHVVSEIKEPQSRCLAAALPEDQLLVVGGGWPNNTVEIASLH